jgi:hypothetical protein
MSAYEKPSFPGGTITWAYVDARYFSNVLGRQKRVCYEKLISSLGHLQLIHLNSSALWNYGRIQPLEDTASQITAVVVTSARA